MRCRHCGTEIADKALICFRCGAATTEPTFKRAPPRRGFSPVSLATSVLLLALVVLVALHLLRAPSAQTPAYFRWAAVAVAVAIVALRAYARRR
jgi:hypothetical protein